MKTEAEFPQGSTRVLPPRPEPGLAGTHTGTWRQPAQRESLFMFFYAVATYPLACSTVGPSSLHTTFSLTNALFDPGEALDGRGF